MKLIRPLREVSMKECAAYMYWKGLNVMGNTRMMKEKGINKASIGHLTKGEQKSGGYERGGGLISF